MLVQFPMYDEIKLKLLQRGTSYLYKFVKQPCHFVMKNVGDQCYDNDHISKVEEKRYGKAIMITTICRICGHAEIEVFPPRNKGES